MWDLRVMIKIFFLNRAKINCSWHWCTLNNILIHFFGRWFGVLKKFFIILSDWINWKVHRSSKMFWCERPNIPNTPKIVDNIINELNKIFWTNVFLNLSLWIKIYLICPKQSMVSLPLNLTLYGASFDHLTFVIPELIFITCQCFCFQNSYL